jgi:hypothetical protein
MGAARDSSSDLNRAGDSVCPPLSNRMRPLLTLGIVPALPPRPPDAPPSSDARVSPLLSAPAAVRLLGYQPKLLDLAASQILVPDGKGFTDRRMMLPESVNALSKNVWFMSAGFMNAISPRDTVGSSPAEIDCRSLQPIPVRSTRPPARSGPVPSRGYPQDLLTIRNEIGCRPLQP